MSTGAKDVAMLRQQLILPVASNPQEGWIDRDDLFVGIGDHNAFLRLAKDVRIQTHHVGAFA